MKILNRLPSTAQDLIYSLVGAVTTGFALKGFLVPNEFLDGGVTGVSLLIHELYHFNLSVVIIVAGLWS